MSSRATKAEVQKELFTVGVVLENVLPFIPSRGYVIKCAGYSILNGLAIFLILPYLINGDKWGQRLFFFAWTSALVGHKFSGEESFDFGKEYVISTRPTTLSMLGSWGQVFPVAGALESTLLTVE